MMKQTKQQFQTEGLHFRFIPPRIVSGVLWFFAFTTLVMQLGLTLLLFVFLPKYLNVSFTEMQKDFPQIIQLYTVSWLAFLAIPYSVGSILRLRRSSHLIISDEELHFHRKGLLFLGWFAQDIHLKLNNLENLIIIVRRYPFTVLLRINGHPKDIEVNLTEAVIEGEKQPQILPRDRLQSHPLVRALEAKSGLSSIVQ